MSGIRDPLATPATHVRVAAVLYVACIPFDPFAVWAGRTAPSLAALVFLVVWLVDATVRGRRLRCSSPFLVALYLVCCWSLVTALWAPPSVGLVPAMGLLLNATVCIGLADVLREIRSHALAALGLAATLLACLLFVAPSSENYGRVTIGTADENELAFQLSLGLGAVLSLFVRGYGSAALWLFCSGALAAGVMLTGSRTGIATVAAVLLVGTAWGAFGQRVATGRAVLLAGAAVAGGFLAAARGLITDRVERFIAGEQGVVDASRRSIETLYLRTVDDWWLAGVGYGGDAAYLLDQRGLYLHAHGLFFKAWVELGAIGVVVTIALLITALRSSYKTSTLWPSVVLFVPLLLFAYSLAGFTMAGFWAVLAFAATGEPRGEGRGMYQAYERGKARKEMS